MTLIIMVVGVPNGCSFLHALFRHQLRCNIYVFYFWVVLFSFFVQFYKNFVQCACVGVNAMIVEDTTDLFFLLESIIDTKGCMIRYFIRWVRREFLRFMLFFVCKSLGPWRFTLFVYLDLTLMAWIRNFYCFLASNVFFFTVCQLKVVFMLLAPDNFHFHVVE